jgi:3-oxoacyl-[acyl-carrier protein] reductase
MELNIGGKRAVVIGGSSGLGYAVCETLAAEGVDLVLFARDPARLAEAREKLQNAHGVQVETVSGDITQEQDIDRLAQLAGGGKGCQILVLNTPRPPSPMRDFLDETTTSDGSKATSSSCMAHCWSCGN